MLPVIANSIPQQIKNIWLRSDGDPKTHRPTIPSTLKVSNTPLCGV